MSKVLGSIAIIVLSEFKPFSRVAGTLTTTGTIFLARTTVEDIGKRVTLDLTRLKSVGEIIKAGRVLLISVPTVGSKQTNQILPHR